MQSRRSPARRTRRHCRGMVICPRQHSLLVDRFRKYEFRTLRLKGDGPCEPFPRKSDLWVEKRMHKPCVCPSKRVNKMNKCAGFATYDRHMSLCVTPEPSLKGCRVDLMA